MSIGTRIKHLREQRHYSQEYMAGKLNISQPAYSKIESESSNVNLDRLEQIAQIFELNIADLLSSEQVFFNQVSHNHQVNGVMYTQVELSSSERSLYENLIQQLKEENQHLKETIEYLKKKLA